MKTPNDNSSHGIHKYTYAAYIHCIDKSVEFSSTQDARASTDAAHPIMH